MNHASIRYSYSVAGHDYSGSGTTGFGGIPPLEKLEIGQRIPVAYCATEPSASLPGNPQDVYASWTGLVFIWMPLISGVVAFAFALRLRKTKT